MLIRKAATNSCCSWLNALSFDMSFHILSHDSTRPKNFSITFQFRAQSIISFRDSSSYFTLLLCYNQSPIEIKLFPRLTESFANPPVKQIYFKTRRNLNQFGKFSRRLWWSLFELWVESSRGHESFKNNYWYILYYKANNPEKGL